MEREKIELSKKHANDNRNDDQYNSQNGNSFSSDKFNRTRQENNPHFFTSADSNSRPRSLDTSSSWRPHREEIPQRENNHVQLPGADVGDQRRQMEVHRRVL